MNGEPEPPVQVDADAPRDRRWRSAYTTLELAQLHASASGAALYARDDETIRLLALHGIDQHGLDLVSAMWRTAEQALAQGQPYGRATPPMLLLPCTDHDGLAGLLLLQWDGGTNLTGMPGLRALSQVLATALRRLNDRPVTGDDALVAQRKLEEPVIVDVPAEVLDDPRSNALALQTLLEREEWNVTRVSRVLGVTRMTVYNRMRKLGVARQRVRKTPPRRRRVAGEPATKDTGNESTDGKTSAAKG